MPLPLPRLQARAALPEMPGVDAALLDEARKGVFASILFAGIGGDMMEVGAGGWSSHH